MSLLARVRGLIVGYEDRPVANVGDFELSSEHVTLVTGPNGSGKTTLLKTIAGLLRPIAGSIQPGLPPGPGGALFVHSVPFLFAGTVRTNLMLRGRRNEERARAVLRAFHAEDLWPVAVAKLSRGQRQRVGIARALAADPALLLADEPEGGMDADAIACWRDVMQQAVAARHPVLVITAPRPMKLEGVPTRVIELKG